MAATTTYTKLFILSLFVLTVITKDTVKIDILKEPPSSCTRKATSGDGISMHYRGTLQSNGKEFDSSIGRNQPFDFTLGEGMVIQGWEQGVPGMCVGEKRRLTIPPSLGYGSRGFGDIIPAQSTLVFEIELLAIKGKDGSQANDDSANKHEHQGDHGDTFETIDKDGNGEISSEEMGNYIKGFEEGNEEITSEDSIETIVSEIFQEDDKNKDGVISLEEFQHAGEGAGEHPDDDMEESFDGEEEGGEPRVEL